MSDIGAFALNLITARSHVRVLAGFTTCHLSLFGERGVGMGGQIFHQLLDNLHISKRVCNYRVERGCEILSVGFVTSHLLLNWSGNKEESLIIKPDTKNMCSKSTNMCILPFWTFF